MNSLADSASGPLQRTGARALVLALIVGAAACGRRGPPLAPEQVDPEPPRVLPLRQESGEVVVRWYAPRLDSGGNPANLRLRKAIVSYRVLDLHALAAEERASQRQPPEDVDEGEPEEPPPGDGPATGTPEPESPGTGAETATEAAAPETVETAPGEDAPPPDTEPPETAEPETEDRPPEAEPPGEAPEPDQPPVPAEEQPPSAGGAPPAEAETEPEPEAEMEPEQEAEPQAGEPEAEPDPGEPAGEETGGEAPAETPEPEAEPEPTGVLLDYEDLEFEMLSEIESEVPGEERVLELPVEADWIGRRLEITVRYEARGGAGEASEPQSLDVIGPLPLVEGVLVEVGPRELTVRWQDPRAALEEALPADAMFEVFRRRGEESERLGRSSGPSQADADVVWGEEVCYSARLVVAGDAEERVIADPGPVAPAGPEGDASAGASPTPDPGAAETPPPVEVGEGASEAPPPEPPDPQEEAAPPAEEPEAGETPWTPIPIRIPGVGTGALSIGPMSAEACVVPVDVFPPVPPSDLRLFWRTEQTDLSWRESASTDAAGYHVYRSGPDGAGFERLTQSPVEQTSYTDAARDPRGAYRYAVTAVDGADPPNESLPSDPRTVNPR